MPIIKQSSQNNEVNWDDPLNKGLTAWYPMRQKGGNVLRDVAGENHGTLESSMTSDDWVASPETKSLALDFDGVNDYVDCGTGTFGILPGSHEMTLSVWCKVGTFENFPTMLSKTSGTAPYGGWQLNVGSTGRFYLGFNQSGFWTSLSTTSVFNTNEWYLVTATRWNGGRSIFVNGTLEVQGSGFGTIEYSNAADPVLIGRNGALNQTLDGQVSDVRIYNRALTANEVHDLYVASRTGYQDQFKRRYFPVSTTIEEPPAEETTGGLIRLKSPKPTNEVNWDDPLNKGLVAWYPFRQKGGDVLRDVAGENHGTLNGSMTSDDWVPSPETKSLALDFDGTNDYVGTTATDIDFPQLSVCAWVKTTDSGNGMVASQYAENLNARQWYLGSISGNVRFLTNSTGGSADNVFRDSLSSINNGEWNFIVGVASQVGTNHEVYVNGVESNGTQTGGFYDGVFNSESVAIDIGRRASSAIYFDGQVSDVRIYNRALTANEVHDLYVASRTGYQDQFKRRKSVPYTLTSAPPSNEFTLTAETGSFAIAGNDAGLTYAKSYSITAETGSFALAGNDVDLDANRKLTADAGSFVLTGNSATLTKTTDNTLNAGTGPFTLDGNDSGLKASRKAVADTGSFALNGIDSALKAVRKVSVNTGEFNLGGNNAELTYTPTSPSLVAGTGEFALSGNDASLVITRKVAVVAGEFTLNGFEVGFKLSRSFTAATGAFDLGGEASNLIVSRSVVAGTGEFLVVGSDVRIRYSEEGTTSLIQIKSAFIQSASAAGSITGADSNGSIVTP